MALEIQKVHARSMEAYDAALADHNAAYLNAVATGDVNAAADAAMFMAAIQANRANLNALAHQALNPPPPRVPTNQYGLTAEEQDIAHSSFSDPRMTKDDMEKLYAHNKQRYWHMRQTGQYSVDQGSLKR
ncbi:hypothetical protein [Bradyrhizobium sp. Ai1a-2]|uniref:hypothetical protein n=1 Tax=Bradyrhizobium sp. Ai1a-2 TaxID=196490 RepID=UPI00040B43BD|nr:hypothetical protein [Bradyrhizobium sp. Ai1a-2]